jgi:hypothetical protein
MTNGEPDDFASAEDMAKAAAAGVEMIESVSGAG